MTPSEAANNTISSLNIIAAAQMRAVDDIKAVASDKVVDFLTYRALRSGMQSLNNAWSFLYNNGGAR